MSGRQAAPRPLAVAPPPAAPATQRRSWTFADLGPLWVLLAVAVAYTAAKMDIGVDTWISLAGGRHTLAHGVTTVDPFSFNSRPPAAPPAGGWSAAVAAWLAPSGWINQNWLAHVLFAALEKIAGLDALVVWKYVNYAAVAAILVLTARARRASPWLAIPLAAGALLAGRGTFEVRAQDVTNLLAVLLMLLLTVATRRGRLIWLTVPLFAVWANTHGGFTWGLLALAVYGGAAMVAAMARPRHLGPAGLAPRSAALAWLAALAVSVVASPYRLANLTHPLVITAGANAREWRSVAEWRPLAEGSFGEQALFAASAVAAVAALLLFVRERNRARATARPETEEDRELARGAVDLGVGAVLAITCVFALASRRFLPMAYLVGAPLLAQWLTPAARRLARRVVALVEGRRFLDGRLPLARFARPFAWLLAAVVTAAFLLPFLRTYAGPWPLDDRRVSLAERAFQVAGQPWDACRFAVANGLTGRLWTYWEYGGSWAYCQPPDPASGRVGLQVGFDGRAQAAYDIAAFRWYSLLEAGGPIGLTAEREQREPTEVGVAAMRSWTAKRLTGDEVWIAHVSRRKQNSQLARALFNLPTWQVVYVDAQDTLLVDAATPEGEALSAAVDAGKATFPDEVSSLLTQAYRALRRGDPASSARGLELARRAFALQATQRAAAIALTAAREPACLADVAAFCTTTIDDFMAHRGEYAGRHGYYERVAATFSAAQFLASSPGDSTPQILARERLPWLIAEANRVVESSEW